MFSANLHQVYGQDIHYSQFMSSPLNLNPATTGFFNGTIRAALNGKNQWQSVTKPYQTISFAFDMAPLQRRYHRDAFGVGILVNADVAGDSRFSTTSPALSVCYYRALDKRNKHMLGAGIQAGWVFRSINYSALNFDNQYNGSYYDPNIGHNEDFRLKNYSFFDLAAGAHYHYQWTKTRNFVTGLGIAHLVPPKISFMGDETIKLDKRWTYYAGAQIDVTQTIDLLPQLLFMTQGPYREIMLGAQAKYLRNRQSPFDYTALMAGLYYRNRDALVFMAGFDYKQFTFGLSYDMNVSKLRPASYYRGGLEFSLVYIYSKYKSKRNREIPCPIF